MKYIDAEKLKEKIDEVRQDWLNDSNGLEVAERAAELGAAESILDSIDDIITSLQQEQPEVDFENKLDEWMKYGPHTCYPWCSVTDAIEITARHFYNLALNARKEE